MTKTFRWHGLYLAIYTIILYLLVPFIILKLLWRSRNCLAYRHNIKERFGYINLSLANALWLHAVSLGEAKIALALAAKLRYLYPHKPIYFTTTTITGASYIKQHLPTDSYCSYCPYDLPHNWVRLFKQIKPQILIIIETELWPHLLLQCAKRQVPVIIANGCISLRSLQRYRLIKPWLSYLLSKLSLVIAQDQEAAQRFVSLGLAPERIAIGGNIKFDICTPDAQQTVDVLKLIHTQRPIWIAASTHEGEELALLSAQQIILRQMPNALLILVPRHPERCTKIARLISTHQLSYTLRSTGAVCAYDTNVYLVDSIGELLSLYTIADLAFVGGSLAPIGGHNLLEPAALAKPVLSGNYLSNFADIAAMMIKAAVLTVVDKNNISKTVLALLRNPAECAALGNKAQNLVKACCGATMRHLDLMQAILNQDIKHPTKNAVANDASQHSNSNA